MYLLSSLLCWCTVAAYRLPSPIFHLHCTWGSNNLPQHRSPVLLLSLESPTYAAHSASVTLKWQFCVTQRLSSLKTHCFCASLWTLQSYTLPWAPPDAQQSCTRHHAAASFLCPMLRENLHPAKAFGKSPVISSFLLVWLPKGNNMCAIQRSARHFELMGKSKP